MADIAMQIGVAGDPAAVYSALTTSEGVAGWWTTRNQTSGEVGSVDRMWFPEMPMAWELRVDEAVPGKLLTRHCVGGPPQWIGTDVRMTLEAAPEGGTRLLFDHTGFAQVDEMFRMVTLGWAQMLLRLKQSVESGEPVPFFDF
jgi:uncharacterized protein YndB with AHSA1/START domain